MIVENNGVAHCKAQNAKMEIYKSVADKISLGVLRATGMVIVYVCMCVCIFELISPRFFPPRTR